jgi:hypothetical protein
LNYFLILLLIPAGIGCSKPANGETISITTTPQVSVDMSLSLLKRSMKKETSQGLPTECLFYILRVVVELTIKCYITGAGCSKAG